MIVVPVLNGSAEPSTAVSEYVPTGLPSAPSTVLSHAATDNSNTAAAMRFI
jgi:hypothetical protein